MVEVIKVETSAWKGKGKKSVGRPVSSTTKITQMIKARVAEKLYKQIDPVIDAQIESAIGRMKLTTLVIDARGGETMTISETAPNTPAAKLLLENVVGKPKEVVEHKGAVGIVHLVKQLETQENPEG